MFQTTSRGQQNTCKVWRRKENHELATRHVPAPLLDGQLFLHHLANPLNCVQHLNWYRKDNGVGRIR